ncbi:MAG: GNAT family N-acetyltransferase [Patescibacteria group bacterium]
MQNNQVQMVQQNTQLTQEEVNTIYDFILNSPNIIYYSKKELTKLKPILIRENQYLVGFCLIKDIGFTGKWSEIAILGVLESYQGKGYGKNLFNTAIKYLLSKNKSIYCVSRNQKVLNYMQNNLFKFKKSLFSLNWEINLDNIFYVLSIIRIRESIRKSIKYKEAKPFVFGELEIKKD